MSKRAALVYTLVVLIGCAPQPLPPPAPTTLRTSRPRAEVVRLATRELTSAGFEVTASDTTAGSVTAKRTRERRGNFDYITCKFAEASLAETNLVSTLTVTVTTSSWNGTNAVDVGASVLATYPGLEDSPLPRSESRTDCVSTGVIEKQIAGAISRAP
jgi:hypothetical protein